MAVAPDHGHSVVAFRLDFGREDVSRNSFFVQNILSRKLVYAQGALALETQSSSVDPFLFSVGSG